MRQAINIREAAKPAGHYSHAVVANGFVFVSCQGPRNPKTGDIPKSVADQTRQVLSNLETILRGVGSSLAHTVKLTVLIGDSNLFSEYDAAYRDFFTKEPPARTTIECPLGEHAIEADCIAVITSDLRSINT